MTLTEDPKDRWPTYPEDTAFIRAIWRSRFDSDDILVFCDYIDDTRDATHITKMVREGARGEYIRGKTVELFGISVYLRRRNNIWQISQNSDRDKAVFSVDQGINYYHTYVPAGKTVYAIDYKAYTWSRFQETTNRPARIATPRDRADPGVVGGLPSYNTPIKRWPVVMLDQVPDALLEYLFWAAVAGWSGSWGIKWGNFFVFKRL